MLQSLRLYVSALVLFSGLYAKAEVVPLLDLHNILESTQKPNYPGSDISLEVDAQGHILHIIYGGKADPQHKKQTYDLQTLNSRQGAILESNHDALVLFGSHVDSAQGGVVILRHIYNGILNTYHHCPAFIKKTEQGHWAIFPEGKTTPISVATLVVYSIGIRDIRGFDCH